MPKLTLGFISAFNERVEPLMNGTVKAEGIELIPTYSHPAETFWRQLKFGEFEVAEMSMSSFLIAKSQGADMVALPVFPSRRLFQTELSYNIRLRHHEAGRPCRQKTRRCRVSANRGALDPRHLGTRLRCVAI